MSFRTNAETAESGLSLAGIDLNISTLGFDSVAGEYIFPAAGNALAAHWALADDGAYELTLGEATGAEGEAVLVQAADGAYNLIG